MSLTVSPDLIAFTKSPAFESYRQDADRANRDQVIDTAKLNDEGMSDLINAAQAVQDNKTARALESILLARAGKFDKPVPNFKAFQAVLLEFIKSDLIDGWIYVTGPDGKLYPQLVTDVTFDSGQDYRRNGTPMVLIETASYGFSRDGNYKPTFGVFTRRHGFHPQIVAKRRVADILAEQGIFKETPALKAAHQKSLNRHYGGIQSAFAQQFRIKGKAFHSESRDGNDGDDLTGRRVIHDLDSGDYEAVVRHADSTLFNAEDGVGQVPEHPVVRVFDLSSHGFYWVHADNMDPYAYDESLRHKLVLPETHRDPWANMARNGQNKVVYLLVRDGMNIHRVYSSVESHLGTDRLFPTKNDQEEIFRGLDGSRIKFEDVAYTDHLRKHERFALHFKRFLLLACGLDHRLKLFGDFYDGPASLHFVSMDFQERYCRFLHDDDASTMIAGGPKRPGFEEWLTAMNGYLRSGSRVLCNWYSLMNSQTAPGACKVYHGHSGNGVEFTSKPLARVEWAVVYRDGDQLCVDVRVQKDTFRSDRKFNCKVSLLKLNRSDWRGEEVPYLVLDAVDPEDLRWYIQHRGTRQRHLEYIRFFKRALKLIESDREAEAGARAQLLQALHEGDVGEIADRPKLVDRAVIAWRAVNRGQPLPQFDGASPADAKAWKSLLDQMFVMAGDGLEVTRKADAEAFARKLGYEPLRLVLTGDAKYMLYAAPKEEECDNRLEPHAWVHRITMARDKAGFSEVRRRWEVLPERDASVTVLAQWPDPQGWTARRSRFASVGRKASLFAVVEGWQEQLATFTAPMEEATFAHVLADWRRSREAMKSGGYVREMHLAIPIAVALLDGQLWFLCVGSTQPQVLISRMAPSPKAVEGFKAIFVRPYMDKGRARAIFAGNPDRRSWGLSAVPAAEYLDHGGVFVHDDMGVFIENLPGQSTSPLLGDWFAAWRTRHPKALLWTASGVLDADGRLALDPVLSISLPEDYQPVRVREITLRPNDDPDNPPEYGHWFDISPLSDASAEGSGRVGAFGGDGVVDKLAKGALSRAGRSCGWSSTSWDAASPSKAIERLKRQYPCLVAAVELPEAPQPPEGHVRWYVMTKG